MCGILLVVFVIQRNSVIGYSMVPTLDDQDQLLVEKVTRWFGGIQHGDIITIKTERLPDHTEGPNIVKRVIGLPGDTVDIRPDGVYLNLERLDEPYLPPDTLTQPRNVSYKTVTLGEREYYVLGDNRDISLDSRNFGPVAFESIIGEVLLRFYPLESFGTP